MSFNTDDTISKVAPQLDTIAAAHAVDGQNQSTWEQFLAVLSRHPQLLWKQRVPADQVGTSRSNRGGLGIRVIKALANAERHFKDGYSFAKACEGAVATSVPPPPHNQQDVDFNAALSNSQEALPPLAGLQIVSIGSGHGNAFIRAVLGGATCAIKSLAPSGFLDADVLRRRSKGFDEALMGLEWTIIHHKVAERWPKLIELGVTVLNNQHVISVSELEGAMAMHAASKEFIAKKVPLNWLVCEVEATRNSPPWKSWAAALAKLCQLMDEDTLRKVNHKVNAKSAKDDETGSTQMDAQLGGKFVAKLATMKWKQLQQFPRVRAAALVTQLVNTHHVVDGRYEFLNEKDVKDFVDPKNIPKVVEMEKVIDGAVAWLDQIKATTNTRWSCLGKLDERLTCHFLSKGEKSEEGVNYADFQTIAQVIPKTT
jgi:hypothetical protein